MLICVFLCPTAFRTTGFGNCRLLGLQGNSEFVGLCQRHVLWKCDVQSTVCSQELRDLTATIWPLPPHAPMCPSYHRNKNLGRLNSPFFFLTGFCLLGGINLAAQCEIPLHFSQYPFEIVSQRGVSHPFALFS